MARVTVEDCLDKEDNRFALVILASTRTRQLMKGSKLQLESLKFGNKSAVLALREIAKGKVKFNRPSRDAIVEYVDDLKRRFG